MSNLQKTHFLQNTHEEIQRADNVKDRWQHDMQVEYFIDNCLGKIKCNENPAQMLVPQLKNN